MKINKLLLLIVSSLTMTACSTGNDPQPKPDPAKEKEYWNGTYTNPLFVTNTAGNFYNNEIADPCVVRGDDGYLYAFATAGRVLRSEDGCEWTIYSENIIPRPSWGDAFAERPIIWAPDVVKIGDNWIYYYSLSAWGGPCGIGYATAEEIGGPYTDHGCLFTSKEVGDSRSLGVENSIDQQVIIDEDGSVYMVFGSFVGCYLIQLTEDGMGLYNGVEYQKANKVLIAGRPTGFDGNKNYEGSWIFKKDNVWYYMGSVGSCCNGKSSTYHVLVGKSDSLTGPYYDSDGKRLDMHYDAGAAGDLVVWSTSSNEMTKAPGHHSMVIDDAGDYWWYGHCFYEFDKFATRHLAMDKVLWDENDMPYLEGKELSYNDELDGPRWLVEE